MHDESIPWMIAPVEPDPATDARVAQAFIEILNRRDPERTWVLVDEEREK